jgi:hypothetical protein
MNDNIPLKPWLDDPDVLPEVRDLLRVAQVDGPTDADLTRLARRLSPAVGLAVLTPPTRALAETVAPPNPIGFAPVKVAAQGLALKALIPGVIKVVAVVGTVGLTAMLWPKVPKQPSALENSATRVQQHVVSEAPAHEPTPAPTVAPALPNAIPIEPAPPDIATSQPAKPKEKLERKAKPIASKSTPIAELSHESELTLIRRAQDMRGSPNQVLSVLSAHERTYPEGVLVQEREVLAIEALLASGRRAEAEKRAARMEQRFAGSAHLRRVRVLLETSAPE